MKLWNRLKKINPLASVASEGILSDIDYYIDTGSYALNALLSGSIFKGFPGNRIVGFAGPTSAGKTYLAISILKNYQSMSEKNFVICYDTEGRLTKDKLQDAGIIVERYFHAPIRNLEQFKNEIIQGLSEIKDEYGFAPPSNKVEVEEITADALLSAEGEVKPTKRIVDNEKFFFILDSLSQAGSEKEEKNAMDDHNAADMGLRAKLIKSVFRNITMDLNILKFPMIVTSHVYDSMKQYEPSKIAGGSGLQYAASIIVECLPTKDSAVDEKGKREVKGTNIRCVLRKSELTRQWKSVVIKVNFANGLDRFSGLFDIAFNNGIIEREGKKYIFPDGNKYFMKEIEENPEDCFSKESLEIIDKEIYKIFAYGKGNSQVITTEEDQRKVVETVNEEIKQEKINIPGMEAVELDIPDIGVVLNPESVGVVQGSADEDDKIGPLSNLLEDEKDVSISSITD
jgi:RecA/RadA recombinase